MSKEIENLISTFNPYDPERDAKALANEIIKLASVELLKEQKYCSELLSRVVEAILGGGDAMAVSNETNRFYIQKKKINE